MNFTPAARSSSSSRRVTQRKHPAPPLLLWQWRRGCVECGARHLFCTLFLLAFCVPVCVCDPPHVCVRVVEVSRAQHVGALCGSLDAETQRMPAACTHPRQQQPRGCSLCLFGSLFLAGAASVVGTRVVACYGNTTTATACVCVCIRNAHAAASGVCNCSLLETTGSLGWSVRF